MKKNGEKKIIVVEDQAIVARDIQETLRQMGYNVPGVADTGEDAIEMVKLHEPDLVLMDIRIRGNMDGIETAKRIGQVAGTPVIFITAHSDKKTLERAKLIGPYGYLLKPFERKELEVAIEMALYKRGLETALEESRLELEEYRSHLEELVQERSAELASSEEKYRTIIERANDIIIIIQDSKIVFCNERAKDIMGYEPDYLIGKDFSNFIAEPAKEAVIKSYMDRMKGVDVPPIYETVILDSKGNERTVEVNASAITFKGKMADMALVRDLTYRVEMESELRANEKKYRLLMETANDAIFLAEADTGILIDVNKRGEELIGRSKEEIIGMSQTELHPPEEARRYAEIFKKHIRDGSAVSEGVYVCHKDGRRTPVMISASTFELDGKLINQGIFHDLTERKKAEEEIRSIKEQFEFALGVSDIGFTIINEDHDVEYVDPGWADSLGDYDGKKCYDYFNGLDCVCDGCSNLQTLEKKDIVIVEKYLEDSDKHIEVHNVPIRGDDGRTRIAKFVRNITEKKKAEMSLAESEVRFRTLAETSSAAIFIHRGGKFLYFNRETENMSGYSREELENMNFLDVVHPDYVDIVRERAMARLYGKEVVPRYEIKIIHKSGREVWLDLTGKDIVLEGKPAVIGTAVDITERKKSEEAPLLTQFAVDRASDAIFWLDTDGSFFYANNAACESLGYSKDELLSMNVFQISADPPTMKWEDIVEIIREKNFVTLESVHVKKDGSRFPVEISVNHLRYSGRDILCAFVRDITNRKKAEEEKAEYQNQLDAFFQASRDGIGIQKNGVFIYANPRLVELFGCDDPSEIIGNKARNFMTAESREMTRGYHDNRASGKDAPDYYEFEILRKDGTVVDAAVSISTYRLKDSLFTVSFVRDITVEKKRREEELQRRIMDAQLEMKSIITDIFPIFIDSMGADDRASFVANLSERLDAYLKKRYSGEMVLENVEDVGVAYINVLSDLGGEADQECPGGAFCDVTVTRCPWDNQNTRNLVLCILCRGIAWRFAQGADFEIRVQLVSTMADGSDTCVLKVER